MQELYPLYECFLGRRLKVPQVDVTTFGAHSQSGRMSGMPLQTGDPSIKGAGGTVEMIGRQRADKRLLKTLEEIIGFN